MKKEDKDTLIALLKYERDLSIFLEQKWYRIPVRSAPRMVRENKIKYLALYQPGIFKKEAFKICWYGEVKNISIMKRLDLLPSEVSHPQADKDYYMIQLIEPLKLNEPIFSRRKRRILFITTTLQNLQNAKELNDVFYESPLEEIFWKRLKLEKIDAERQMMVEVKKRIFYLDFAIFSAERNIDIECDGDTYHNKKAYIEKDKQRSNILESDGWSVLRYTTDEIYHNMENCIQQVKETVNRYGGLQDTSDLSKYQYLDSGQTQLGLFDGGVSTA